MPEARRLTPLGPGARVPSPRRHDIASLDGGCSVAQIAKSLVFRAVGSNRAVLIIASLVLVVLTLGMNALAIWLRYRLRKNIKW